MKLLILFIFYMSLLLVTPKGVLAWSTNPYPNPGGTFDCSYTAWITDGVYNLQILTGGGNIKWLQAVNNSGSASWNFPLIINYSWPTGAWPETYIKGANTDAETFTQYSLDDSFAFQDGGPGVWEMQQIPDGQYHIPFNGDLDILKLSVSFWTTEGVWSRTCTLTSTNPSPTPVPTPNPSPTPTPHTKVVFAPGLGASWNSDAIINCDLSPSSDWMLAPYAEDVYTPVFQAINEYGWTILPFYYDWRKQIPDNLDKLSEFINLNLEIDEKTDLVGHSMGGLIGRAFLETAGGSKINSLLTIGSPHKGSALAYPVWAEGHVWNNNLIEKIAVTLYIKRCGGQFTEKDIIHANFPSIQNLLPIEPFLQKIKTTFTYLPSSENSNNWLPIHPFSNPWNIKIGTIAGVGFDTLTTIQTKDPSKNDLRNGDWEDGRISGKFISTNGDGTVLVDSAILSQASYSAIINQSHRGLVTSAEGMTNILEFLGKPTTQPTNFLKTTAQIEPNSALVVIGYPSSITITDQKGKPKNDKNGVVSFINPESGSYILKVFPKADNTLLIIAQFLPNKDVKYKEYNFRGTAPIVKTLKFNLQNPQDDILNP